MSLDVGDPVTVEAAWVDTISGALVDATTQLVYTDPSGNATTIAHGVLTHPSTGLYRYTITADEAGVWTYQFTASGAHTEVETGYFYVAGSALPVGPCEPWLAAGEVFRCAPASAVAAVDRDYALAGDAAAAASRILFVLSRRRYPGVCVETIRPCPRDRCGRCGGFGSCRCGLPEIALGGEYPVLGIQRVRVDGTVVAPAAYRVDDRGWFSRIDGGVWPSGQDMTADPASEADTFDVSYYFGAEPPIDGKIAAARLAAEFYSGCTGGTCALPANISNLSRQGETLNFIDPVDLLTINGRMGIREVDRFLDAEDFGRANLGTVVASPEFTSSVRRS